MNKNKSMRTALIIVLLLTTFFTLQLLSQKHKYNRALECIADCDYRLALSYLDNLPTYKDSTVLAEYASIMSNYNPNDFESIYSCYHSLKDISPELTNKKLSGEFIRAETEISTIYENYNVLTLCK